MKIVRSIADKEAMVKVAEAGYSEAVERELVATLYRQTPSMIVGVIVNALVALIGWYATRQTIFLGWIGLVAAIVAGRIALEHAYHARRDRTGQTARWRRRYDYGAWAVGAAWGCAAFATGPGIPLTITFCVITVVAVTLMGAAARNAGSVLATRGQLIIALTPLVIASICQPDPSERALSGAFVALFAGALMHAHQARRQSIRFLEVSEDNAQLAADVQRANSELAAANLALSRAASIDALTGIANRRRLDVTLANEVLRARRERTELSFFMIDIDYFKRYNDRFGHRAGDDALVRVAAQLAALLRRPADLVARYGGEEFVAVLPQTDGSAALQLAQELCARVEALDIPNAPGCGGRLTVSVGVTSGVPTQEDEAEDFIRCADAALYAAKSSGRNCVRVGPAAARLRHAYEEDVRLILRGS
jgi:diguanylate cyclase (GGDEF)-like protein